MGRRALKTARDLFLRMDNFSLGSVSRVANLKGVVKVVSVVAEAGRSA
jgi:hypothetical protein